MLTTIGLIYRWCLKTPESVIKRNKLYCICILLALLRIHRGIFERVCCLPKTKTTKKSRIWDLDWTRSRIGSHDNFVKTKDILSRFKDHFWSVMLMMFHLKVFYLPALKQVVGQYKMWNDVMFWFSQIIIYKQQKQYLLSNHSAVKRKQNNF